MSKTNTIVIQKPGGGFLDHDGVFHDGVFHDGVFHDGVFTMVFSPQRKIPQQL